MISRPCDYCGELYEPKSKRSRFCKPAHRVAALRRREQGLPESVATVTPIVSSQSDDETMVEPSGDLPSLHAQTLVELQAAEREHSSDGVAALIFAKRIDDGATGSAAQALFRSWLAAKSAALANASPKGGDVIDELAARRSANA